MNVTKKTNIEGRHLVDSCPKGTLVQGGHGAYLRRPFLVLLAFILAFSLIPLPASFAGESSSAASTQAEASASAAASSTAETQAETTSSSAQTSTQTEESSSSEAEEATSSTTETEGTSSAAEEEISSSSSSESPGSSEAADSEGSEVTAQSEAAYTVASFVGYKDMFTALAKTKIDGDKKTNQAALNLPTKLWVKLDAASLTAYKTDHAAEYAASETARTAHNDALSGGTPAEPTAADPYSNVTIPEDAVQVSVTKWTCRDNYEATDYDLYTFDPTLDEDFGLATGVDLPFLEVEVGEVKAGARADYLAENEWIAAVNTYTTGKDATQAEHFYDSVPFTSTGTGNLEWQSAPTGTPVWDGNEAGSCPNDGVATYNPTTVGELLKAFRDIMANTDTTKAFTINIQNDMDMAGQNGFLWPSDIKFNHTLTLNGNGHTLYNLYMKSQTANCGFIQQINNGYSFYSNDLKIDGANVLGSTVTGSLVGLVSTTAQDVQIAGCSVKNALTISRGDNCGGLIGRFAMDDTKYSRWLDNCNSHNVVALGAGHIGTLTGAIALKGSTTTTNYINRCYAVGGVVVSFGGHSGGLFSCMGGTDFGISNCFVDAQVYGQVECGVFSGVSNPLTRVAFMNCFSSGFVDGKRNLGGFLGSLTSGSQVYFFDCYSTALVGVNSSGEYLGGFLGYAANGTTTGPISCYSNCYAAGEVGNASTNSAGAAPGQTETIGGFLGCTRLSLSIMANCFYDKQTTAMREFDVGGPECLSVNTVNAKYPDYSSKILKATAGDIGLLGTLTSTTTKSGAGLTSAGDDPVTITTLGPSGTTSDGTTVNVGFTGMRDDRECFKYTANTSSKGWNDSTTFATNAFGWDTSADGHYPELVAFSNNKAGFSAEDAAVAAAYSKSSTSTAKLETWEKGLKASNGQVDGTALPATTYDTVRDISTRFDLTSSGGENWFSTATQDGADNNRATTIIQGKSRYVMDLLNDGIWYGDSFSPGMEWLRVGTTVNGVDASRRLRVTPTAGLEAGESQNRYQTSTGTEEFYDHADDVLFFYTTAARWAADEDHTDVTTGVYPDTSPTGTAVPPSGAGGITRKPNDITSDQTLYANGAGDGIFDSFFGTGGGNGQNDLYGTDGTDAATGLDMSYMSRDYQTAINGTLGDNSANGSHVYTYIRPISGFDPVTGEVSSGNLLETWNDEVYADRFNGYQVFDSENSQYLIEYVWQLNDGRLIRDAKIFTVKAVPFDATIKAYESGGIDASATGDESLADTDDVFVGIDCDVTDIDNYNFANQTVEHETDVAHPDFGSHVVASWKNTNELKLQTRLKVEFIFDPSGAGADKQYFSKILENPKAGDTLDIPYTFWRIITLENGKYYSIPQTINRIYTVKQDATTGCMYLYFDKQDEKDPYGAYPELTMTDMEDSLVVSVELSSGLVLHKDTNSDSSSGGGDYADLTKQFTYNLYFNDGLVDGEGNPTPGTYTYNIWNDNGTPNDYSDDTMAPATTTRPNSGIFVSGTDVATPVVTTSADGSSTQTVALSDNEYVSILGAKAGYEYRFEELDYKDANGVDTQLAKYSPAYAIDTGDTTAANSLNKANSTWNEYSNVVSSTSGRDTGAQTLPDYADKTVEGVVVDNTISRIGITNTFKEVVPSGVSSEAQWPWLLLLAAFMMVLVGGGYAVYRNKRAEVIVVRGKHRAK